MVRLPPKLRPLYPVLKPAVVSVTRRVAPLSIAASRRRGGLVPTGSARTLEEAAHPWGTCTTVRPEETIDRLAHLGLPAGLPPVEAAGSSIAPRTAVAELPGGRVLGPHRAVITGDGRLVDEVSRYFVTRGPREHPLYLNPFPDPPTHVPGTVAVLACRGDSNYYHFLVDAMSRLNVLAGAGLLGAVDTFYVPTTLPFQRDVLAALGIDAVRCLDADTHPHVQADRLLVPSLPAMHEVNPPWVVAFLRERLLAGRTPLRRDHVYVTRGGGLNNRVVRNEDDVVARLADRGFRVVDPGAMTLQEQVDTFSHAALVVSGHGAALANLMFVPEGAGVIEMFPAGGVLPDYWRLVTAVPGVEYRYLSRWPAGRPLTRQQTVVTDIDVDLAALERLLDELGDRRAVTA